MNFYNKLFLSVLILLFCFRSGAAQNTLLSGRVHDNNQNPLIGAAIMILKTNDSSLVLGTATDTTGYFSMEMINPGKYLMKISYIGFRDFFREVNLTAQPVILKDLILYEKSATLKEVLIEDKTLPARQMGDTTQFNANAFKANPDASAEDLVNKMPGISQQDGKVQAQGEDVKSVLVDGKPFFGEDPNSVLKNIPAEVIDKIQVFDRKSDQSLFTGFDDGNTSKTINIITKPQFRNGTFGKVFAGYGYDDRYKSGAILNFFKGKRRMTLLAQSNNINEQNFSMEDLAGVMSSPGGGSRPGGHGGGGGFRGQYGGGQGGSSGGRPNSGQGNDVSNFLVGQNNGINTTHAFGLNYSNQWKKFEFTGSYFFNYTGNKSGSDLFRQYTQGGKEEGLTYNENKQSESNNINHRATLKLEYKFDSLRSVTIQPRFTAQLNNGSTGLNGNSRIAAWNLSNSAIETNTRLTALNFSVPVLFRNAFVKKGRTISLNVTPGYSGYDGETYLLSTLFSVIDSLNGDSLDQLSMQDKNGLTINGNLTYTEPVNDHYLLNFSWQANFNENESEKETFDREEGFSDYGLLNISLSNSYKFSYYTHAPGAGIRYQKGKVNYALGVSYQVSRMKNHSIGVYDLTTNKYFASVLPNAMLSVRFSEKKNLRLYYRSSNNPPSIDQLQNVVNNSNTLQVAAGNPELRQDLQHFMNIRYSAVNTAKNSSLFALFNCSYTLHYIGSSTTLVSDTSITLYGYKIERGAQVTQPLNFDKAYTLRAFINYGFAVSAVKSNLNVYAGTGYSRIPGLTNGKLNYAGIVTPAFGISLSSNFSAKVDFMISSNTTYTSTNNSLHNQSDAEYLSQSSRFKLNLMPWKGLVFQTEFAHQFYSGLTESYNDNYLLWNAGLGYKFMKNQVAEIRFSVFDILDQNKSITRNITETYYEDVKTNILQRYFMMTLTYNLKFYKDNFPKIE